MPNDKLTIANKAQGNTFSVNVKENVVIRNYKPSEKMGDNCFKTTVKNGKVTNEYKWSNVNSPTKERAMNLGAENYSIMHALKKADKKDKDGNILSQSDLKALYNDKAMQKKLGVQVKFDPKENVYGIYGSNGSRLYFDFE